MAHIPLVAVQGYAANELPSLQTAEPVQKGFAIDPKFSKAWGHVNTVWQVQMPPLMILQWESGTTRFVNTVGTITWNVITQQSCFMKYVQSWIISGNCKVRLKSWVSGCLLKCQVIWSWLKGCMQHQKMLISQLFVTRKIDETVSI